MKKSFNSLLRSALRLNWPYSGRDEFQGRGVPSSVLVLFGWDQPDRDREVGSDGASLLFIRRAEGPGLHAGQMAFPGGRSEPADLDDVRVTALREAQEEVGVAPELVEVIGELPPVLTPTSFRIHPVVGALQIPRSALALQPDPSEVAEAIWIPFSALSRGEIFRQGVPLSEVLGEARWSAEMTHGLGGRGLESRVTDVFQVDQYCIWGATAAMTKNLLERIQASGSAS